MSPELTWSTYGSTYGRFIMLSLPWDSLRVCVLCVCIVFRCGRCASCCIGMFNLSISVGGESAGQLGEGLERTGGWGHAR